MRRMNKQRREQNANGHGDDHIEGDREAETNHKHGNVAPRSDPHDVHEVIGLTHIPRDDEQ